MTARRIIILVIGILFLVLVIQNTQPVDVKLFFWKASMSRAILYILLLAAGVISGWVACLAYKRKGKEDK